MRVFAITALVLAGCAQTPPPATAGTCNADAVADLVGKPATRDLGIDAQKRSGARTLRWIQPGTAVTMDFRPDRLNGKLDAANLVTGLSCS